MHYKFQELFTARIYELVTPGLSDLFGYPTSFGHEGIDVATTLILFMCGKYFFQPSFEQVVNCKILN